MGHERAGRLPRTKRWRRIVEAMSSLASTATGTVDVAVNTLRNVRDRYAALHNDKSLIRAFTFLIALGHGARTGSPEHAFEEIGIKHVGDQTPIALAKSLSWYLATDRSSAEYAEIARQATIDALVDWYGKDRAVSAPLFPESQANVSTWNATGHGSGFCEIARSCFAHYTDRYLRYFLEREASSALPDLEMRTRFDRELADHIQDISRHAFETAKITQSFAAGWYNKHAVASIPQEKEIRGFLFTALGKMRSELLSEELGDG